MLLYVFIEAWNSHYLFFEVALKRSVFFGLDQHKRDGKKLILLFPFLSLLSLNETKLSPKKFCSSLFVFNLHNVQIHNSEHCELLSALMCTRCVCLSINVWSVHQQLLLSTFTLCYSILSCVSWVVLAVRAFRSAPKSPALVRISWRKRLSGPGLSALACTPS